MAALSGEGNGGAAASACGAAAKEAAAVAPRHNGGARARRRRRPIGKRRIAQGTKGPAAFDTGGAMMPIHGTGWRQFP